LRFARGALVALVFAVSCGPIPAADAPLQRAVFAPGVRITTVGGSVLEGVLLNLRFSGFYGTGQCPGLVYDTQKSATPEFTLNVGAERRTIDYHSMKSMRIDWREGEAPGLLVPTFTIDNANGDQIVGKCSWMPSTSTCQASLVVEGAVMAVSARCDSPQQRSDLITLLEFGRDCDTTPTKVKQQIGDLQKQVADKESAAAALQNRLKELEKQIADLNTRLKEATDKLAALEQESTTLKTQIADMQDKATKKEDYIKSLLARIEELKGAREGGKAGARK